MKQTVIFIDNRVEHIVDFEGDINDVRQYVIKSNGESTQELFRFFGKGHICLQENKADETYAYLQSFDVKEEQVEGVISYSLDLQLTNEEKNKLSQKDFDTSAASKYFLYQDVTEDDIEDDANDKFYKSISLKRSGDNINIQQTQLKINVSYAGCCRELLLFVAPAEKIADAVIDFGSEASQIALCKRSDTWTIDSVTPVFEDLYHTVKNEELDEQNKDNEIYDQADTSNNKLFRSIFFAKTTVDDEELKENPVTPAVGQENELLRVLTKTIESQEITSVNCAAKQRYIQLPNIKISRLGGVAQPLVNRTPLNQFKDNYYYRASLNHFILNTIRKTAELDDISSMTITVLMPNVYDQYAIFAVLKHLRTDIAEVLKSYPKIKCIELTTLSESDASLLGALSQIKNLKDGNYLILDAGKGTLDYSVINVENNRADTYHSIYRGGIIGAGNTITTAYVAAFFYDFVKLCGFENTSIDDILSTLIKNVLGISMDKTTLSAGAGDTALLKRLVTAADRYKIAVNNDGYRKADEKKAKEQKKEVNSVDDLKNITLESFVVYVEKQVNTEEGTYIALTEGAEQLVSNAIENLCDEVMNDLGSVLPYLAPMSKEEGKTIVDGVLFAGRGFKHKAFKDRLKERLNAANNKILQNKDELSYLGLNSSADEKNICLFVSPVLNDGAYDGCRASLFKETHLKSKGKRSFINMITFENLKRLFKKHKETDEQVDDNPYYLIDPTEKSSGNDVVSDRFMSEGVEMNFENRTDRVLIGGAKYNPRALGEYRIFFTSDKIIIRSSRGKTKKITGNPIDLQTSPFLLSSLFPVIFDNNGQAGFDSVLNNLKFTIVRPEKKSEKAEAEKVEAKPTEPQPKKDVQEKPDVQEKKPQIDSEQDDDFWEKINAMKK